MKIVLITPPIDDARGNRTTVDRWCAALLDAGHDAVCIEPDTVSAVEHADIVHGHQATHTGPAAIDLARRLDTPAVISLGGTDIHGTGGSQPTPETKETLLSASTIIVPNATQAELIRQLDDSAPPTYIVERCLSELPSDPLPFPATGLHIVMVGGIRPVKGQLEALQSLTACTEVPEDLALSIVGPTVDENYAQLVQAHVKDLSSVIVRGAVPHRDMSSVFAGAHALLNYSRHEGASNAILEAWSYGRSVAASDVPGNHELMCDAPASGAVLLDPRSPKELQDWLHILAQRSSKDWANCAREASEYVMSAHSPRIETQALLKAYKNSLIHP